MSEVPASASVALRPLLGGPPRPFRVLAALRRAVYAEVCGRIVAVVAAGGVALPNAVLVPWSRLPGVPTRLGGGAVAFGPARAAIVRWWDPVPRAGAVLADRLAEAAHLTPPLLLAAALATALDREDPAGAAIASRALIGFGPGLTPAGDDVVAGLLAGLQRFGAGAPGLGPVRLAVARAAEASTTTPLSAALLAHAARGEVCAETGKLISALSGYGDVAPAVARLRAVGHTSGESLLAGVVLAARAASRIGVAA